MFKTFNTASVLALAGFVCLGGLSFKYDEARAAFVAVSGGAVTGYLAQLDPAQNKTNGRSTRRIKDDREEPPTT